MAVRTALVFLVVTALTAGALPAVAQLKVPGLELDRVDLSNVSVNGSAQIKGLKPPKIAYGISGFMVGGQFSQTTAIFPCWNCGSSLASTLVPPFAWGALTWFATPASSEFFFLGGSIFSPDSVKRTARGSGSRIQLKQKNHLGIFISAGIPGGESTTLAVAGCKGQADIRDDKPSRFKMSCKAGALDGILAIGAGFGFIPSNENDLRAFLKQMGLKSKIAFSLEKAPGP